MATNRADTLDPALLRPGRLDRKIEFPLPDRRQKRLVFQVSRPGALAGCIPSVPLLCSAYGTLHATLWGSVFLEGLRQSHQASCV